MGASSHHQRELDDTIYAANNRIITDCAEGLCSSRKNVFANPKHFFHFIMLVSISPSYQMIFVRLTTRKIACPFGWSNQRRTVTVSEILIRTNGLEVERSL